MKTITHDSHDRMLGLPEEDLERLTFCRQLNGLIKVRSPLLLDLPRPLDRYAVEFVCEDFLMSPRQLLANQREAIDSLRTTLPTGYQATNPTRPPKAGNL